jgi:hypothetical protein
LASKGFGTWQKGDLSVTAALGAAQTKELVMGLGAGIFLIAVGAVLAFAVHATVSGMDIQTVGVILMVVGALGVVLDLIIFAPRRRTVVDGGTTTRTVVEDRNATY